MKSHNFYLILQHFFYCWYFMVAPKAHWGVVTGLLLPPPPPPPGATPLAGCEGHYLLGGGAGAGAGQLEAVLATVTEDRVRLVVRQSKSLELEIYDR